MAIAAIETRGKESSVLHFNSDEEDHARCCLLYIGKKCRRADIWNAQTYCIDRRLLHSFSCRALLVLGVERRLINILNQHVTHETRWSVPTKDDSLASQRRLG